MNINGTYKISIEMTARNQVLGLVESANRLTGGNLPVPPDVEEEIERTIQRFKADGGEEEFDAVTLEIDDNSLTLRSSEGEETYQITERNDIDENQVRLQLTSDEIGDDCWNITRDGEYYMIDGMEEYIFRKVM